MHGSNSRLMWNQWFYSDSDSDSLFWGELVPEWYMILKFEKVKHRFLMVEGVNFTTKTDSFELRWSKWSEPIQIKAFVASVSKNIVNPNRTNRKGQKMAFESPRLDEIVFKRNGRIFAKHMHNHMDIQPSFLNKKIERLLDSLKVFLEEFLHKMNLFNIFCIFKTSLMS